MNGIETIQVKIQLFPKNTGARVLRFLSIINAVEVGRYISQSKHRATARALMMERFLTYLLERAVVEWERWEG